MQNLPPPREMSPSPPFRDRARALKAQSMPLVPSVMQLFGGQSQQQSQGSQPSPTTSNSSRRSPVPTVSRHLPSPPKDQSSTPPNMHTTHYPRPITRIPPPQFLTKYGMEQDWKMTDELLADIERADLQQAQVQGQTSYTTYTRGESDSPHKDPVVERVRASDRSSTSPKEIIDSVRGRQEASPQTRDRQPTSPTTSSFPQQQHHTPERRPSPSYHTPLGSPGEHNVNYTQYGREPAIIRRPPVGAANPILPAQTRASDRSLPVQEEQEDEEAVASRNNSKSRDRDRGNWDTLPDLQNSPTPSSDTHPNGHSSHRAHVYENGRTSRAGHREDDDDDTLIEKDSDEPRAQDGRGRSSEEEETYTPRSPIATLPDNGPTRFLPPPSQNANSRAPVRVKPRTGATDQMGLRGIDPTVFEQTGSLAMLADQVPDHPPQYAEHRRAVPQQYNQQYNDRHPSDNSGQYYPDMHSEDLQNYLDDSASAYLQSYLHSPRPNAPIPPTPHSQTAAPSPSISGHYGQLGLPSFSPAPPMGSPYPYPFTHVRRSNTYSGHPNRPPISSNYDPNHPSVIQEQLARQWQVYAQNNQGPVSDSTFSPSGTPAGPGYNTWAYLHTNRTLGRPGLMHDPMSLQSSPSHEPIPLPPPPNSVGLKKKDRLTNLRNAQAKPRKPPPRVDSTQPRETSPEPSSSGEETAGEEQSQFAIPEEGNWVNGAIPIAPPDDGEWIDEDDDGDDEDLLDLEYHPSYVSNVEKRRRRWDVRWEGMIQAVSTTRGDHGGISDFETFFFQFQALDRQTDATLVLLAAPSHSTKLHTLTSRSIRRDSGALLKSSAMSTMRTGFRQIASQRRITRSHKPLVDMLMVRSESSDGDGTESREEELKSALGAALGSLSALGTIYEQREARWNEEMRRISEDRERVEMLLSQALGNHVGRAI